MAESSTNTNGEPGPLPSVTLVFLVFNRREELRESLQRMLNEADYDGAVDVIVVDNASDDDSSAMLKEEFPQVHLIRREVNCGVSGWNDGFAVARGDYVLALDDDCYLPGDGLRRAVEKAQQHEADLVSFGVRAMDDPDYRFNEAYRTGLLTFWGCAVLMRRPVLEELRGYDPEIFVWANELEFMLRFFDSGLRHLHAPEIVAVHQKDTSSKGKWKQHIGSRAYRLNTRHFAYIAAKLLHRRDAAGAVIALVVGHLRDALRMTPEGLRGIPDCVQGFVHGLRHRAPLNSRDVSRVYRRSFHSYASPWWISRPLGELARAAPRELFHLATGRGDSVPRPPGRRSQYYTERSRYYPSETATLEFQPAPVVGPPAR